ncbi:MAG: PhzF family phenazine biosynthesis protein [Cyanobacteria bacterium Co-bin13]|nr:PhzF family phenazine biosynthesis protein [Cyanobacteria bacterium Co-bin13]
MTQTVIQVDAFTNQPFAGNPAAVCVMAQAAEADWMGAIAAEMNLSETAFLYPIEDGFHLRWFTPAAEVDLCGHATLASAHTLWSEGHLNPEQEARFHTRSGLLTAIREGDWITLNFPSNPVQPAAMPPALQAALQNLPVKFVGKDAKHYLVELETESAVRELAPDFSLIASLPMQGVIVTSQGNESEFDFVSRFFAPTIGINEDPVTGAAHCSLAPYWQEKLGKSIFLAYQASARGGVVKVRCECDRVFLSGQAVTVMRGELSVSAV